MFEDPFCAESFTCNCLSYYLHSVWVEYQVFHLIRYLEDTFPWNAGSHPTSSGVSTLHGFLPEVLCGNTCNWQLGTRFFLVTSSPFGFGTVELSRLFFDSTSKQDFFSVALFPFISFSYKIGWILLNFHFILIYSVVLMWIDKMTGQKVKKCFFPFPLSF